MLRREFLASLLAVPVTKLQPKVATVYMVSAKLKCTTKQKNTILNIFQVIGKTWNKNRQDWQIKTKLYGAWEE